jgi:RNA polymerase sigma-70 factor (ECF subfamily)
MADHQSESPTRQSLLGRLKDWEDQESWRDFFDTYWKLIYGVALKSGLTEPEAQDVVQETVLSVARKMKNFQYDPTMGSFRGFLLQLTQWRINDQFRKRSRQPPAHFSGRADGTRTATVERLPDTAEALEAIWNEEWHKNLLEVAVQRVKGKVKPKQYQIFDLYVLKKWPVKKVMKMLGVSFAQVYLARHRIGRLLKKEIQDLDKDLL